MDNGTASLCHSVVPAADTLLMHDATSGEHAESITDDAAHDLQPLPVHLMQTTPAADVLEQRLMQVSWYTVPYPALPLPEVSIFDTISIMEQPPRELPKTEYI